MITIIVGKSCSGKDTTMSELVNNFNFNPIISTTTRPKRDSETDGVEYNFTDTETFLNSLKYGTIFEYRKYETNVDGIDTVWYYGSSVVDNVETTDYVTIMDIDGCREYIDQYGSNNCFIVYLLCSDDVRKQRSIERGSYDKKEWNRRAKHDDKYLDVSNAFDIMTSCIKTETLSTQDICARIVEYLKDFRKRENKNIIYMNDNDKCVIYDRGNDAV